MIGLRLIALDSDPYHRLSWSSGLLTDEGFYIHNARNVVLFGTARTDQFNNMLIMPTLHFIQVAVFRVWGVGAVQARMISVVCSLLMLAVFFAASRRAFGPRIAYIAVLFLGLDHITLLYNRMALMDTPGALLLICGFYCWVAGIEKEAKTARAWLFLCGLFLGLAYCTRGLAVLILPVPFLVLLLQSKAASKAETTSLSMAPAAPGPGSDVSSQPWRRGYWVFAGLAFILALYLVIWYLPNRQELSHVNSFYLWRQLLPHSIQRLALNLWNGCFGDDRGMAPFLMRHSPAQTLLAWGWMLTLWSNRRKWDVFLRAQDRIRGNATLFIVIWLLVSVLFLCVVSYSPSRYYVLFTPALAVISALALVNIDEIWCSMLGSRWALPFIGGYCGYHFALATLHHGSIASVVAVGLTAIAGALGMNFICSLSVGGKPKRESWDLALPVAAMTLWAAINTCYLTDWLRTMTYEQRDAGQWLAANLPPDTILLGDVAPGLCMDNRFHVVNVIAGLCNDRGPVKMYLGHRRAIVILDERMIERGWVKYYPDLVRPERRIKLFPDVVKFPVGVYMVDERDL